jgi:hypothetical protein
MRTAAVAVFVAAALLLPGASTSSAFREAASTCPAARVRHEVNPAFGTALQARWVAAQPRSSAITGVLFGGEEIDGRFALYPGGHNPVTDTNEKVLWVVDPGSRVGSWLTIVGHRIRVVGTRVRLARGSFRSRRFFEAGSEQTPGRIFPSIVNVPKPGCWRLEVRSGPRKGRLIVFVQPVPGG